MTTMLYNPLLEQMLRLKLKGMASAFERELYT